MSSQPPQNPMVEIKNTEQECQARIQNLENKRPLFIQIMIQAMAERRERANMLDEIIANANSHRFEAWTRSWLRGNHDIRMTCIAKNGLTEMLEKEKNRAPTEKIKELEEQLKQRRLEQIREYHEELRQELVRLQQGGSPRTS